MFICEHSCKSIILFWWSYLYFYVFKSFRKINKHDMYMFIYKLTLWYHICLSCMMLKNILIVRAQNNPDTKNGKQIYKCVYFYPCHLMYFINSGVNSPASYTMSVTTRVGEIEDILRSFLLVSIFYLPLGSSGVNLLDS